MGAIVTSNSANRTWAYTNGTFDVLLGSAYHFWPREDLGAALSHDLEQIVGGYLSEKWPDQYSIESGALHYLDLDKYSQTELIALTKALRAAIDMISAEPKSGFAKNDLFKIGNELIDVVVAASSSNLRTG
jgi:hypothetical protein